MASRMDRYKNNGSESRRRFRKNKDLYNTIYSLGKYSNIEGVASISKENEVDIAKVKEMLESREKYQKQRRYRNLNSDSLEEVPEIKPQYTQDTQRDYDIRDILNKAREEKEPDDKERVLKLKGYEEELKSLKLDEARKKYEKEKYAIDDYSQISEAGDDSGDLFSELQGNDTKVGEIKDINELLGKDTKEESVQMDDSFFTTSLRLNKSDFVGGKKKSNALKIIVIIILIIVIILAGVILYMKRFN